VPLSKWENEFAGVGHLVGYDVIWWAIVVLLGLSAGIVTLASLYLWRRNIWTNAIARCVVDGVGILFVR